MAKSHCIQAYRMGNIFVSAFGKYNLLHAWRKGNMGDSGWGRRKIELFLVRVAAMRKSVGKAFQ